MAHAWSDLPNALSDALPKANKAAIDDGQLNAFVRTEAITSPVTFGIKAAGSDGTVVVTVTDGNVDIKPWTTRDCSFVLSALPEQWQEFMKQAPVMPYQSYWAIKRQLSRMSNMKANELQGMFGMNIKQEGIEIQGDHTSFATWTHVWRRVLELLHDAHSGATPAEDELETEEDHIVGRYVYITSPLWRRAKVFYEQSGEGAQEILFLHTAGSDGRQYHGVLNDPRMRKACRMTAFDLPAHGRSFPYQGYYPGVHTNTEDAYVGCIAALVKKLGLKNVIVCGASMAGQISLACAIRYKEVGCIGTIPLQGSDHLDMDRQWHDRSPYVSQSHFNPEWIYGMMSPTAPLQNRQLIWPLYSAQAYGIFMETWTFTLMAQKTCDKIPGGKHQAMKGLGHFPATENPKVFVGYLIEAIDKTHR